ncbi:MAG: hypothetical protein PHD48_10965 [Alphaproteobacteria bacterium]|nr:hypothetical protein [Alphaproteobacteria bacterium]
MNKLTPPFSVVLSRKPNGDVEVYQRPYNPCKTVKIDEDTHRNLGLMAKGKGTSRHAEMRTAIQDHILRFLTKTKL